MEHKYRHILVGIDGSKEAEKAFEEAVRLSADYNSKLFIAWVDSEVEPHHKGISYSDKEQSILDRKLTKKIAEAEVGGVKSATAIIKTGDPKKQLAKLIPDEFNIDLIIIGATGKNPLSRIMIGSTANYVVTHAPCTVTVVK